MAFPILYPDEKPSVHRYSSIDQFKNFLSVMKNGGWAPIVFDQLDGINCETIKHHPVVIAFGENIGYVFPEAHCACTSDKFIYFDKYGVEQKPLPYCFGGVGEFYDEWMHKNTFINFDNNTSVGAHNTLQRRVGLSYALSDKTLPAVD